MARAQLQQRVASAYEFLNKKYCCHALTDAARQGDNGRVEEHLCRIGGSGRVRRGMGHPSEESDGAGMSLQVPAAIPGWGVGDWSAGPAHARVTLGLCLPGLGTAAGQTGLPSTPRLATQVKG